MAQFILGRDTPLSISIQGDWGSGKSSFLNLVEEKLIQMAGDKVTCMEFNCWQYAQFGLAEDLPLLLMIDFAKKVYRAHEQKNKSVSKKREEDEKRRKRNEFVNKTVGVLWGFAKAGGRLLEKTTGIDPTKALEEKPIEVMDAKDRSIEAHEKDLDSMDFIDRLGLVKQGLKKSVEGYLAETTTERIVVFIDDLDRLSPLHAVELLEGMKTFLDLKGCVFVSACDFEVVKEGVRSKFQFGETSASGKSFFDKVFQLSFNLPTGMYKVNTYLRKLLEKTEFETELYTDADMEVFKQLLWRSVGFNPRNIKRLVNNLTLVNMIDKSRENQSEKGLKKAEKVRQQQILFALGCMECAFNKAYQEMLRRFESDASLADLLHTHLKDERWILKKELIDNTTDMAKAAERLTEFNSVLVRLLDQDNSETLDKNELKVLRQVMAMVNVTAATRSDAEETEPFKRAISTFFNQVFETIRNDLGEVAPTASSRSLKGKGSDGPWWGYWFKDNTVKKAWSAGGLYYFLRCDLVELGEMQCGMWGDLQHVEEAGIKAGHKKAALAKFASENGYEWRFKEKVKRFEIKKQALGQSVRWKTEDDISTRQVEDVAKEFKSLIEKTHHMFDLKQARRISGEQLAKDVRSGMNDQQIMSKYSWDANQLRSLLGQLVAKKIVSQEEIEGRLQ